MTGEREREERREGGEGREGGGREMEGGEGGEEYQTPSPALQETPLHIIPSKLPTTITVLKEDDTCIH